MLKYFRRSPVVRRHHTALNRRDKARFVIRELRKAIGALFHLLLGIVLLTGAVVLVVSFLELRAVDVGFDPDGLLAMEMSLTSVAYETPAQSWEFQQRLLGRIGALPGVTSAATVSSVPLERGMNNIVGIDGDPEDNRVFIEHRPISPSYFRTLGVPVLLGREFSEADTESSSRVAIINRELADRFWPDGNPLGNTITIGKELGDIEEPPREIVGVVGNIKAIR